MQIRNNFQSCSPLPPAGSSVNHVHYITIKWDPSADQWGYSTTYHVEDQSLLKVPISVLRVLPSYICKIPMGTVLEYSYYTDTIMSIIKFLLQIIGIDPLCEESIPSVAV